MKQVKERPILFSGPMVRALLAGTKTQTRRALKPNLASIIDEVSGKASNLDGREDEVTIAYLLDGPDGAAWYVWLTEYLEEGVFLLGKCPHGQPGDLLWVRETFRIYGTANYSGQYKILYRAAADGLGWSVTCSKEIYDAAIKRSFANNSVPRKFQPSIHMPRAASRLLLEIVSVRVERLQAISEADAVAEGVDMRQPAYYETGSLVMIGEHNQGIESIAQVVGGRAQYAWLWNTINGSRAWESNPWVWVVEFKVVEPAPAAAATEGRREGERG